MQQPAHHRQLDATMTEDLDLPQEVWSLVIDNITDDCWAWLVLRRVSPTLRRATEDCFALKLLRHCRITFNDPPIRPLLSRLWSLKAPADDDVEKKRWTDLAMPIAPLVSATISFEPIAFLPDNARTRLILKVRGESHDQARDIPDDFFEGLFRTARADQLSREGANPREYDPRQRVLHRQICTLSAQKNVAETFAHHSPQFVTLFGPLKSGVRSLLENPHFVCVNENLKSLRIPDIGVNLQARLISVDWRSLCQAFYLDGLRIRRALNPHSAGPALSSNNDGYPNEHDPNRWLFWDFTSSGASCGT